MYRSAVTKLYKLCPCYTGYVIVTNAVTLVHNEFRPFVVCVYTSGYKKFVVLMAKKEGLYPPYLCSFSVSLFCFVSFYTMNHLVACGINLDQTASEFEQCITRTLPGDFIPRIRDALFLEALEAGLTTSGDALVQRRKTNRGKSVKQKHVTDIWQ